MIDQARVADGRSDALAKRVLLEGSDSGVAHGIIGRLLQWRLASDRIAEAETEEKLSVKAMHPRLLGLDNLSHAHISSSTTQNEQSVLGSKHVRVVSRRNNGCSLDRA